MKNLSAKERTLRIELLAVKQKLSAVTVDTPHEDINKALQQEATLALRLTRGEAELQRVENEIGCLKQLEHGGRMQAESERREKQRKRDVVLDQVAGIDDLLSGRKLIKPDPSLRGDAIADDIWKKRAELVQLRARVMAEAGLTEADIPPVPVANATQLRPDGSGQRMENMEGWSERECVTRSQVQTLEGQTVVNSSGATIYLVNRRLKVGNGVN